jgi:hypothetical protein
MKSFFRKFAFTSLGLALFAWLLTQVDVEVLLREVLSVGVAGFAIILAISFVEFLVDVLSWQLTINTVPINIPWTTRLFLVRIAGEAYNMITPLAGMGDELVKRSSCTSATRYLTQFRVHRWFLRKQ